MMKTHEWKTLGRVIYGSRKTAFFEEKKANFAAGLNCTTQQSRLTRLSRRRNQFNPGVEVCFPTPSNHLICPLSPLTNAQYRRQPSPSQVPSLCSVHGRDIL